MKQIESYFSEAKEEITAANQLAQNSIAHILAVPGNATSADVEATTVHEAHNRLVNALFRRDPNAQDMLVHATMGISGEAGELLDAVKKHWAYDKKLDIENVLEECGDLLFYIKALLFQFGLTITDAEAFNHSKLSKRYSSGTFSTTEAQTRADKAAGE